MDPLTQARGSPRALLRAHGLGHRFGTLRVLDDVGLEILGGRLCVVLGPNGAGKTTLLRVLSGVLTPEEGSVELEERALRGLRRRQVARTLAVVPQDTAVPFPFLVREIVAMGRAPHLGPFGREGPGDRRAIEGALGVMGLETLSERPFSTLSGGERQRVLLARALAQAPAVLLLDEPTAHMDLGHRLFVFEALRAWIESDRASRAAVVVTHDLNLAAAFGDEVVLLHQGRVVASGEPSGVLEPERIESVYAADVEVTRDSRGRPLVIALRSRIRYSAPPDGSHR